MSQENVEIVRLIHEEWARGNLRAGAELHDADIVFIPRRDLPDSRRYLGPEGIREWMRRWLDAWTKFTLTAEEMTAAGDSVVVGVRQRGIGKQSGAEVELTFFQVWTFRGPSVIRIEQFGTKPEALRAVGLSE